MLKQSVLCAALGLAMTQSAAALEQIVPNPTAGPQLRAEVFAAYALVFPEEPISAIVTSVVLTNILDWLSQTFDLTASVELPRITLATPQAIAAVHYRSFVKDRPLAAGGNPAATTGSQIAAVYDHVTRTIYLPHGWRGETPAEMSVLVHEMVHHLQHLAGIKYGCPEEREKLAYLAQNRWLERFGRSLEGEFELDGFTLLVRTNCGF